MAELLRNFDGITVFFSVAELAGAPPPAAFVFGGNLIANVLYGVVDPRMRKGAKAHA